MNIDSDILILSILICFIIVGPLILIFIFMGFFRTNKKVELMLLEFDIYESSNKGVLVNIIGRTEGIQLLSVLIGADVNTHLTVTEEIISIWSSRNQQMLPLSSVSSVYCDYTRSLTPLMLGMFSMLVGFIFSIENPENLAYIVGLFFLLLGFFFYLISQRLNISIETVGGMVLNITLKKKGITGPPLDFKKCQKAMFLISKKVEESRTQKII